MTGTFDTTYVKIIDLILKSQNGPDIYPTMRQSEQKWVHFSSEWSIMGYETGAIWDLWKIGLL